MGRSGPGGEGGQERGSGWVGEGRQGGETGRGPKRMMGRLGGATREGDGERGDGEGGNGEGGERGGASTCNAWMERGYSFF